MRRKWGLEDLIECWALDEEARAPLANKTGATRLGFAVILKFFEQEAWFPRRERHHAGRGAAHGTRPQSPDSATVPCGSLFGGAAVRRRDVCAQPGQQRAETLARGNDRRHVLNRADGLQLAPDEE